METVLLIIGSVTLLLSATAMVSVFFLLRKKGKNDVNELLKKDIIEANKQSLQETREAIREFNEGQSKEIANQFGIVSSMISNHFNSQTNTLNDSISRTLAIAQKSIEDNKETIDRLFDRTAKFQEGFIESTSHSIDELNKSIRESLENIRKDTDAQLDKMRDTVDEKLHKSLEERLTQSFSLITERLEKVNIGLNEMQNLSKSVTDLNKVLGGVKTRGNWGEVALKALLSELLVSGQYLENVEIKKGKKVEFCLTIPTKDKDCLLLPVDCKFPYDKFNKIVQCSENGDLEGLKKAQSDFEKTIKEEAKNISEYIVPPKTTDFAIMYLPVEGLYAEVARNINLIEEIRRKYNVIISGPSTFTALLNSLQIGFQAIAMQKNSTEIQKALQEFKKQFGKFLELLERSEKQLGNVANLISEMKKRSQTIDGKLSHLVTVDNKREELLEEVASDSDD